jgi:hypothetical protein
VSDTKQAEASDPVRIAAELREYADTMGRHLTPQSKRRRDAMLAAADAILALAAENAEMRDAAPDCSHDTHQPYCRHYKGLKAENAELRAKLAAAERLIRSLTTMRDWLHLNYNGGWHAADTNKAFHHGMDTVCNVVDATARPLLAEIDARQKASKESASE